jgi:CubicO group peptidase (beta-lactamase class C family)
LKTLYCLALLILPFIACNFSGAEKKTVDDSLQYYPPTPAALSRDQFRNYYRQLSAFFDTTLLNKGFNGGILVAKNGAVIYEKYHGKTDIRKKDSLTGNTPLHIASTSKTFTGIAVLRLVQEGRLSLNDTLEKFFPRFPYPGITIKMLLCHRSGLPNYVHFMSNLKWGILPNKKWNKQLATNRDVLKMMYEKNPDRAFAPDSRFNYCNTNYVLLALIIEKISGVSYPDYMQQKFFQPLQMKNSFVFTGKDTLTAAPSFTPSGFSGL